MSAGPGHVQRTIIGTLTRSPYKSAPELVVSVYGLEVPGQPPLSPTKAQIRSVSRALCRLREQGLISKTGFNHSGYRLWMIKDKPVTYAAVNAKLRAQKPRLVGADHA